MSSSLVLKLGLVLLLSLTLGWKLVVRTSDAHRVPEQDPRQQIVEFLIRHNFTIASVEHGTQGLPIVRASAGACRIMVIRSPALGWDHDLVRRSATPADHVFVAFGGKIYPKQPTWRTVSDHLWARLRRELGQHAQPTPVFAVVATRSCEAERLPWNEIGARQTAVQSRILGLREVIAL